MPEKRNRDRNQQKSDAHAKPDSGQSMSDSERSLVKGVEAQEVDYKPRYQEDPPTNPFWRWLWKYSQSVLSVLTVLVLVIYGGIWYETRTTRELENRAYVVAKGVTVTPATVPTANDVLVTIVNVGRTPGRNGYIVTQLERRVASPPEDTVINPKESPHSQILFGPQIEVRERAGFMGFAPLLGTTPPTESVSPSPPGKNPAITPSPNPTPTPQMPDADERLWYLYGHVAYDDIFGKPHTTKFCFENIPFTGTWSYCPTYNSAD
jgi:hypothetical protein